MEEIYLVRWHDTAVTEVMQFTPLTLINGTFMIETLQNCKTALTALDIDCALIDDEISKIE